MRAIAALAIAILCVASGRSAQAAPIARLPLFDQRGATFTLQALRGAPAVVSFIATRCTDVCPIVDGLFSQLESTHAGAQLVTITLDPRYDTPFVMSRYARALNARAPYWRVASGKPADIERLLDAFGVAYRSPEVHSTLVYCLDAHGRLAKILPLSTRTADDVRAWLAALPRVRAAQSSHAGPS